MRARALPHPFGVTSSTYPLYPRSLTRSLWQKNLANSAARSRPYFPARLLRFEGRQPALGTAPSCPCGGGFTGYGVYVYNSELYKCEQFTFTTVNSAEFTTANRQKAGNLQQITATLWRSNEIACLQM